MGRVIVISTGGTIASRWQGAGFAAEAHGKEVMESAVVPDGVTVEVQDLFSLNSSRLTTAHQLTLLRTVRDALADPGVDGVVVTHGTDTLEESAFLLDLHHDDPRPVVFTGAQRAFDAADGDGPSNLRDALLVAAAPTARELGVLIAFDGTVHAARGTVKRQTLDTDAFGDPSGRRLGKIGFGKVSMLRRPRRPEPLPLPAGPGTPADPGTPPRVDVIAHHPDADATLLNAAVEAGAQGLVLVGTGAGNATPEIAEAVASAVSRGVLVALTTRVPSGPVAQLYTRGGAVDLVAAGAVPTGTLRAGQARIATLSALLATSDAADRVRTLHHALGLDLQLDLDLDLDQGPGPGPGQEREPGRVRTVPHAARTAPAPAAPVPNQTLRAS